MRFRITYKAGDGADVALDHIPDGTMLMIK